MQWNTGRSYKLDRARHNKSEEYEVPVNKRKRRFKSGGKLVDDKKAMVLSQIKEVHHHADELAKVLANMDTVDAWVVGKMERATTDLSDITHYLDGTTEYAKGGMTNTFDNILLENGFKKIKTFAGVRFFQNGDIFASVDDKNRIVEVTKREGQIIYKGYNISELIYVVTKQMADGGMMADGGIVYDIEWKDEQGDTYEASFNDLDEAKEEVRKIRDEGGRIIQTWKYRDGNYVGSFAKGGEVKSKTKKYQILSPDGITIEREVPYYTSKNKAMNAFDKWKENYSRQGYYSSVRYGRIDLSDLADYCQFITL